MGGRERCDGNYEVDPVHGMGALYYCNREPERSRVTS